MDRNTQPTQTAVLIVGAGPVGLSLAVQLQRLGISHRIIDRNPGPSSATKAMAIHSRTLEIFRELGVAETTVAAGKKIQKFRVQSNGATILLYDFELLDAAYPFLLSLPQPKTEGILLRRLEELGGSVEWCTELTEFSQDADRVTGTLRHADGSSETTSFKWLVGCDGARSVVRRKLELAFDGDSYHRYFVLADVDIEWDGSLDEGVFFLGSQAGYVAVAPIADGGRYRLFVEMPTDLPPEDQRPKLELSTFQELCQGRGQPMRLANATSMTAAAFQHRRVERQQVGRVFLAGDAAHIGSPIGGQYMNMGIAEAYNLAWKLCYVERGLAGKELLDSYDAERRPVAVEAEKTAHVLTKILTLRNPALLRLRDLIFPRLSGTQRIKRKLPWMISGHRYNYRTSPIVADCRSRSEQSGRKGRKALRKSDTPLLRAGDLAPDLELWSARGEPVKRLLDVLSGGFTLLLFTTSDDSSERLHDWLSTAHSVQSNYSTVRALVVLDALETPELDTKIAVLLDPDWRVHRRYGAALPSLVLIRPDGYVAFLGSSEEDLFRYLEERSGLRHDSSSPVRANGTAQDSVPRSARTISAARGAPPIEAAAASALD